IDSRFPNGRRLGGGSAPNRHQVNVNTVLISLIVAGDPDAGLAKGTEVNDKDFLDRFPFLALAHQGLLQGHGGINVPTVPDIPNPDNPSATSSLTPSATPAATPAATSVAMSAGEMGGGCAMQPGAAFDPTLVGVLGLMLVCLGRRWLVTRA